MSRWQRCDLSAAVVDEVVESSEALKDGSHERLNLSLLPDVAGNRRHPLPVEVSLETYLPWRLMSSSNKIRLGQSVGLLVSLLVCPFREAASTNSDPIELGMVLNEGEDRKTLLRRCTPRRRCLVLEI